MMPLLWITGTTHPHLHSALGATPLKDEYLFAFIPGILEQSIPIQAQQQGSLIGVLCPGKDAYMSCSCHLMAMVAQARPL